MTSLRSEVEVALEKGVLGSPYFILGEETVLGSMIDWISSTNGWRQGLVPCSDWLRAGLRRRRRGPSNPRIL